MSRPTNSPRRAAQGLLAWVDSPEARGLLPIGRQSLQIWLRWLIAAIPETPPEGAET